MAKKEKVEVKPTDDEAKILARMLEKEAQN